MNIALRLSLLFAFALHGCDTAKPDPSLIVGHWQDEQGSDLYLGPIDHQTGKGSFIIVNEGQDHLYQHTYTLLSTHSAMIKVRVDFTDGTSSERGFQILEPQRLLQCTHWAMETGDPIQVSFHRVGDEVHPPATQQETSSHTGGPPG